MKGNLTQGFRIENGVQRNLSASWLRTKCFGRECSRFWALRETERIIMMRRLQNGRFMYQALSIV